MKPRSEIPVRGVVLSGVRHAKEYLRLLEGHSRLILEAVWEGTDVASWMRQDSWAVARERGLPVLETDEVAQRRFDAALVCSEPTRHAELALWALGLGLDVIVDKPVATDSPAARAIAERAAALGRTVCVISRLGTPAMRRGRAAVDSGRIGMPRHVDVEYLASGVYFATSVERPELVVERALSGGGEMMNFLGYAIDAIHYLTGCAVLEVHCEASTLFSDLHREAGVEDVCVASFGLSNGVTATATVGRVPSAPSSGPVASSVRVLGSHGHLTLDDETPAVMQFATDGSSAAHVVGNGAVAETVRWTVEEFLAARESGPPPSYTVADAVRTIEVIEAASESARTGKPVPVPSPHPSSRRRT